MENKYTGEVPLKIGEHNGVLVYDWAAVSFVKTNLTPEELDNLAQVSPEKLALVAAAGFKKKSPEITVDVIMEASPSIMEVATAIDRALLFAFHGPENARQILEPIDKMNEDLAKGEEKKTPKKTPKKTK